MAQSATVFGDAQLFAGRECLFRNGVSYGSGIFWAAAGENVDLVDAGGKLPIVLTFVDTDEHVGRVLPRIKEMAAQRLIVRENVVLEQGNLE